MNSSPMGDSGPSKRILIVDDHPVVRQGLTLNLNTMPGFSVCGQVETILEALKIARKNPPDLILADLELEGGSGLDLIKSLRQEKIQIPVVILSMHDENIYAERTLRAGGRGYLMKSIELESLVSALNLVLAGEIAVSDRVKAKILVGITGTGKTPAKGDLDRLTDRELEVFRLVGQGLPNRMIAERLSLSAKTIEAHLAHIKSKLGFESGTELKRMAFSSVIKP